MIWDCPDLGYGGMWNAEDGAGPRVAGCRLRVAGLSMIAVFISAFAFFIEKTKDMVILT
jgi:hypothetical protein